jgi:hypothetical protein
MKIKKLCIATVAIGLVGLSHGAFASDQLSSAINIVHVPAAKESGPSCLKVQVYSDGTHPMILHKSLLSEVPFVGGIADGLGEMINSALEGTAINFSYGEKCEAKTDAQKKHQFKLISVVKPNGCGSAAIGLGTSKQLVNLNMHHAQQDDKGTPCETVNPNDYKWTHEINWGDVKVGPSVESAIPSTDEISEKRTRPTKL